MIDQTAPESFATESAQENLSTVIRDRRQQSWFWVDKSALVVSKLFGGDAFTLYCWICSLANNSTQKCWPGIEATVQATGISRRNLFRLEEKLSEAKLLKITHEKIKGKIRKIYTLLKMSKKLISMGANMTPITGATMAPVPPPQVPNSTSTGAKPQLLIKNKTQELDSEEKEILPPHASKLQPQESNQSQPYRIVSEFFKSLKTSVPPTSQEKGKFCGMAANLLKTFNEEEIGELMHWYFNPPDGDRDAYWRGSKDFGNFYSLAPKIARWFEQRQKRRVA